MPNLHKILGDMELGHMVKESMLMGLDAGGIHRLGGYGISAG
jgi:hypothetical protein